MNTVLGDALKKVLPVNNYSDFVWKNAPHREGDRYIQESVKLVDMSPEELKNCYIHCDKMLNNNDPKNLGRYNVLEEILDQMNKCNVELLLRYYENSYKRDETRGAISRSNLNLKLRQLKANNPEIEDWTIVPVTQIASDLPEEFHNINISDLLDGCIDYLDTFDKKHLTITFITKMGLWFTKSEENELKGENNSNIERLKIARERLRIPSKLPLKINGKGLSYHEMRAILTLPKRQKYSNMTTEQLVTLENKILPRLQREIDGHIYSWKRLQHQIRLVAKDKGINLND